MLKDFIFPATREMLPQMLNLLTEEIKKYFNDSKWINRLKVSFEEILINIIDYSGSENLYISCGLSEDKKSLCFEFVDEGTPYNPLEESPEVYIDAEFDER